MNTKKATLYRRTLQVVSRAEPPGAEEGGTFYFLRSDPVDRCTRCSEG